MIYKVIINTDIIDSPKNHEIKAAMIVANKYFKSDVIFLRQETYSTPDISVDGKKWEIKSPLGNGKKTIDNNLRSARKQSVNIILDLTRIKLHQTRAIARLKYYLKLGPHGFKKVIVISKTKEVIEIL
ncbi:MAG: hypothetical protein WCH58_02690 [Candidatus Saccharibacteria bacterium]